jgi:hypothetical protein
VDATPLVGGKVMTTIPEPALLLTVDAPAQVKALAPTPLKVRPEAAIRVTVAV